MKHRLGGRAALLFATALGFWALGLALTAGLFAAGRAIVLYAPQHAPMGFATAGIGIWVAFGFLPPLATTKDDARPLLDGEQPRLAAFMRDVGSRVTHVRADQIYLTHEANAFASARRVGVFSRRETTLGVGLPFVATLTCDELGAIVGHELGHHTASDVRLGPWVHRTRRAIARAVDRLEGSSVWLHLPFVAYARFFARVSYGISRAQELRADEMAARVTSAAAAASALRKTEVLGAAWGAYFAGEVVPLLENGALPPLLEGFTHYWESAQTEGTLAADALARALAAGERSHEDDSHPTLAERLAALGDPPPLDPGSPPALSLVDDVAGVEERVVRDILRDASRTLRAISWSAAAEEIWTPAWRANVETYAGVFRALTPAGVAAVAHHPFEMVRATRRGLAVLSPEGEKKRVAGLVGAWLAVYLADRGWTLDAHPGRSITAVRDGVKIEPFTEVAALFDGELGAAAWEARCTEAGLP